MNIFLFCSYITEGFEYQEIYAGTFSKYAAIFVSITLSLAMIPFMSGIIWFEQDNHNRTLVNQLVSSLMWSFLCWMIIIQPPTIMYFAFGPLNVAGLCSFHSYARNAMIMHFLFVQNGIMIGRYMLIFHSKNPTAVQDDYWKIFINIWSLLFSGTSQFVYFYLPGKNTSHYHICFGKYPNNSHLLSVKPNLPLVMLGLGSGLIYVFVRLRTFFYTNKKNLIPNVFLNKQTMFSYTANGIGILMIWILLIASSVINRMDVRFIDTEVNLIYVVYLYTPQIIASFVITAYYVEYKQLRYKVWLELKEQFEKFPKIDRHSTVKNLVQSVHRTHPPHL